MPKLAWIFLCAVAAFVAFSGVSSLPPRSVLAASATLGVEAPLHESPDDGAAVLALLPAGTIVSIAGPPVAGFYPVTAEDLSGWMRGEKLIVEKDASAPGDGALPDGLGETAPSDVSAADRVAVAPADVAPDPAVDAGGATPIPVAPAGDPPVADGAVSVGTADQTDVTGAFPDASPTGPATVTAKAPILAGPGPDYGLIVMAPAGSSVEQTGHLIDGYVTVQYAEVTGWAPLDLLGPPDATEEAVPPDEAAAPSDVKSRRKRR